MNAYVSGLFALGGVLLGAFLTPLTQLYLEGREGNERQVRREYAAASLGPVFHSTSPTSKPQVKAVQQRHQRRQTTR
jgi:hypothetical protein